jgi:trimethylamine---corrinoid protein Co-methyltransferase
MLVLQHEVVRYAESLCREIDFSDDALALDEIDDAGPGGTFIDRDHTAEHFRGELWQPHLLDRQFYQNWRDNGATDTAQRIEAEKARLAKHEPQPIDKALDRELAQIVAAARRELTG